MLCLGLEVLDRVKVEDLGGDVIVEVWDGGFDVVDDAGVVGDGGVGREGSVVCGPGG